MRRSYCTVLYCTLSRRLGHPGRSLAAVSSNCLWHRQVANWPPPFSPNLSCVPPRPKSYNSNPRGINGNQQVCNTCNDDLGAAASNSNGQHQLISHPPGDDYEGGEGVSSFLRWASSSRSGPGRCGGEGEMEFSLQPRLLINFARSGIY